MTVHKERLEYLRGELRAERISYGELSELQSLARYIEPGDVELLEAAGVPERFARYVEQGDAAIRAHPDFGKDPGPDYLTCATDAIASILHAAEWSLTPDDIAAGGAFNAAGLLSQALETYDGDAEDLEGWPEL